MNVSFSAIRPVSVIRTNSANKKQKQQTQNVQNTAAQSDGKKAKAYAPYVLAGFLAAKALLTGGCSNETAGVGQTKPYQEQPQEQGVYDPGTKYGILTPDTNEPIGVIDQDEARKAVEDGVRLFNEVIEKYTNDTYTDSGDKIVNQNGQVAGWQSPEDSKFAYDYDDRGRKVTEYEITPNYERTKTFNYNASDDHVLKTTITTPQNESGSYTVEFEEE